ncbi:little elongation complex subunit 2 [Alosa sapidissima]|uniref:little elongation complex subunit 2 n=1 Tax=Alosa sapidissima TaxID=34773 RepID=UPI001C080CCC|nr:little elongation complex subunit 2 [Alosa sapidissima]
MELTWTDSPDTSSVFFTRDIYDKFSLAPNIKELWSILHSPKVKAESQEAAEKNQDLPPDPPQLDSDDTSGVDSDHDADENPQVKKNAAKKISEGVLGGKAVVSAQKFPEPRIPYPRFSAVSKHHHYQYINWLRNRSRMLPPQHVVQKIRQEVSEFMGYLQEAARACAEDYNYISQGAAQYCEEYLKSFYDHVRTYPQLYVLQETTSLLGNVYMPNLSLNTEKQLLAMGNIDVGFKTILTKDSQLSVDYDCVNSANPPSKKARDVHKAVSSDETAERLSNKYEPDVCLTRETLVQILDQSAEFTEDWEVPVWVKLNSLTGKKTVYIDPPLLKKDLTVREKNHLFHEESIKLAFKKKVPKPVFFLMTGQLSPEKQRQPKEGQLRKPVATESTDMEFEVDFTELESFGESTPFLKKKTSQNTTEKTEPVRKPSVAEARLSPKASQPRNSPQKLSTSTQSSKKDPAKEDACKLESQGADVDSSWTDVEDDPAEQSDSAVVDTQSEQGDRHASATEQEEETKGFTTAKRSRTASVCSADSDESRLYIDDVPSTGSVSGSAKKPAHPPPPSRAPAASHPRPATPLSPQAGVRANRVVKRPRLEGQCDQLGQILRMQSAMLKPQTPNTSSRTQETSQPAEPRPADTPSHSLVKSSVTSFLEGKEREDGVTHPGPTLTVLHLNNSQKCLLREDLQSCVEDETDFEAPQEGNVLYKLYSLHDLLVLVRSSIPLGHSRTSPSGSHCVVPISVLPKLEYQLSYGAECVTSSEACRLWADTLLNPSTVSYIARINAHTSKLVELQELPSDWMQSISCDFHPARSLNILHHVLKKVTGLAEGRYLLSHRSCMPHFTILKACDAVASARSPYDLQASYSQTPPARTPSAVPWVPVDPNHLLPFHKHHGRVPCTFPLHEPRNPQQGPARPRHPNQQKQSKPLSKAQKRRRKKQAAKQKKGKQAGNSKAKQSPN